jgi:rubredoxin
MTVQSCTIAPGYFNVSREDKCPKCGQEGAKLVASQGPLRLATRLVRAIIRRWRCQTCGHTYGSGEGVE